MRSKAFCDEIARVEFHRASLDAAAFFELALHHEKPSGSDQSVSEMADIPGYQRVLIPRDEVNWHVDGYATQNAALVKFPVMRPKNTTECKWLSLGIAGKVWRAIPIKEPISLEPGSDYSIEFDPGSISIKVDQKTQLDSTAHEKIKGNSSRAIHGASSSAKSVCVESTKAPRTIRAGSGIFELALHYEKPKGSDQIENELSDVPGYERALVPIDGAHWIAEGHTVLNATSIIFPKMNPKKSTKFRWLSIGAGGVIYQLIPERGASEINHFGSVAYLPGMVRISDFSEMGESTAKATAAIHASAKDFSTEKTSCRGRSVEDLTVS